MDMARRSRLKSASIFIACAVLSACSANYDAEMWECQLAVQKDNAGRSAEAAAERARDITACMEKRGFLLDYGKRDCQEGSVDSSCYRRTR